jgi:hypothetical protein
MHPLLENLAPLKDSEIETKILDLSRKYFQTTNPAVQTQIGLMLEGYKNEMANRRQRLWQDQQEKRDTDLDNLINVS